MIATMEKRLVSVIIPAFRCAKTIRRAVDSALMQKVPVEVIVVDDCPADPLDEVLAVYRDVPEVRVLKNARNLGAAESRNRGVREARGAYIAFLDGDDYWAEGKLQKQLEVMERTGAVLCTTARELMTPEGGCTGRIIPVAESFSYRDLLKHNLINCSAVLLKAEVAREFPMHHADSHEDYILWLEILKKYDRGVGINEPLLKYRLSSSGKSGNKLKSAKMTFMAYRYVGFGRIKSLALFCSYALCGVKKYAMSYFGEKDET